MSERVTMNTLSSQIKNIGREIGEIKKSLNGNGQPGLIQDHARLSSVVKGVETDQEKIMKHCEAMHDSTPESRQNGKGNTLSIVSIIVSTIIGATAVIIAITS